MTTTTTRAVCGGLGLALALALSCGEPKRIYLGEDARTYVPSGDPLRPPPPVDLGENPDALEDRFSIEGSLLVDGTALDTVVGTVLFEVGGDVIIQANEALGVVNLPDLFTVEGDLRIVGNPALTTVQLPSLFRVGGEVVVEDNGALTFLGLGDLFDVAGEMRLKSHLPATLSLPDLQTVGGLAIGGGVALTNPGLIALRCNSLQHIGGPAAIERNVDLLEVEMPSLLDVDGDLIIRDNPLLAVWTAPDLTNVQGGVCVCDNPQLPACEVAQTLMDTTSQGARDTGGNNTDAVCE